MIVRDSLGIILQHDKFNMPNTDAGDSSARVGVMAAFGSWYDRQVLDKGYTWVLNRHPTDPKWSNPKLMSRDQMVCLLAGSSMITYSQLNIPIAALFQFKSGWFLNKDFLSPDIQLHIKLCRKENLNIFNYIVGYPNLFISILWSCYVKPSHELNQIACQCVVAGKFWLKLLYKLHPNYEDNFKQYYGGWRDQPEIADQVISETRKLLKNEVFNSSHSKFKAVSVFYSTCSLATKVFKLLYKNKRSSIYRMFQRTKKR